MYILTVYFDKHELTRERAQQLRLFFLTYSVLVALQLHRLVSRRGSVSRRLSLPALLSTLPRLRHI